MVDDDQNIPDLHSPISNRKGLANLGDSFKEHFKPQENTYKKRIRVILNPAAGQEEPALKIFNQAFREAGYEWDVRITQQKGDGTRLAKEAVDEGVELVVVYGGDGSVMEAAAGMLNSSIPLGIIPGGTGNVISKALGIPADAAQACALIVAKERTIRDIDIGMSGDVAFIERIGVGLEAAITESADREAKNKYGIFAYIISTVQALSDPQMVKYHITIDGEHLDMEGLSCVVANIGDLGAAGITLAQDVDISDGLLDLFVIKKADLVSLFQLAASVIGGNENHDKMFHKQGREINIVSDPVQGVQADGELIGDSPVDVKIMPKAIHVIVPSAEVKPEVSSEADTAQEPVHPEKS